MLVLKFLHVDKLIQFMQPSVAQWRWYPVYNWFIFVYGEHLGGPP